MADSVSATIELSQSLDPRQRLASDAVTVRALPDSTPVAVVSLLPKPVDDSLNRTRRRGATRPRADTTKGRRPRHRRGWRRIAGPARRAGRPRPRASSAPLTSRPPLTDQLVLRVPQPWTPDGKYEVEIRGIRNVSGVAGGRAGGSDRRQEPRRPTRAGRAADSLKRRLPDSLRRKRPPKKSAVTDRRRDLPSVDRLLREPAVEALLRSAPRAAVADGHPGDARRRPHPARRARRTTGPRRSATGWPSASRPGLRPVLNATGVVLHTNLGRAPLAEAAVRALTAIAGGYGNLELDLDTGTRGSRTDHCRELLRRLTGAEDALVVNNAAGALVLALNALAAGRDVLISRGELIEIGGSFRIPDIMARSGARLREVGTTNRTHLDDYRRALGRGRRRHPHGAPLQLRAARVRGLARAGRAGRARGARPACPTSTTSGSGLLADLSPWGLTSEPRVADALAAGADLVLFSGDKLLGGPQAGCLVGRRDLIARCRENPLARALRADKLTLAALEATLACTTMPRTHP